MMPNDAHTPDTAYRPFAGGNNSDRNLLSFILFCLFIYMVTNPFYLFQSGYPQPADAMMAIAILLGCGTYAIQNRLRINRIALYLIMFNLLVIGVNLLQHFHYHNQRFLMACLFYGYNSCIFFLITILYNASPIQTKVVLRLGMMAAVVIELFFALTGNHDGPRAMGTFNNANQLAYFSILAAVSLFLLKDRDKRFNMFDFALLLMCGISGFLSLSKSFIILYPVIVAIYIFSTKTAPIYKLIVICATIGVLGYGGLTAKNLFGGWTTNESVAAVIKRASDIGKGNRDNPEGRGYIRLWTHPEYVFLGAGEGKFSRFPPDYSDKELHSGVATLLFSYGIVGFSLFFIVMYNIFKGSPFSSWLCFATVMAYGMPHQNIRFSLFWVFLSICYIAKKEYLAQKRADRQMRTQAIEPPFMAQTMAEVQK